MTREHFHLRPWVKFLITAIASMLVLGRIGLAVSELPANRPDRFLAVPLAVVLPFLGLLYLGRLPGTTSSEGAIMRLAMMVQILLILALPTYALHLALGFPVALLAVELFETRVPRVLRDDIKHRVLM
jgi:hypothetical protein